LVNELVVELDLGKDVFGEAILRTFFKNWKFFKFSIKNPEIFLKKVENCFKSVWVDDRD
jgi:hypothetical protein